LIVTRTPLRISLGGGGTDLPSYYREFGGFVISAAISKYIYFALNKSFESGFFLKYAETEHVATREAIRHRAFREALARVDIGNGIEIATLADVPAGTGLGSSGAFLVGLLNGLYAFRGQHADAARLAAEAAEIEMVRLQEPAGKQDQYIAAFGGLLCQQYQGDGTVELTQLQMSKDAVAELTNSLMLFFVGQTRSASGLLEDQRKKSEARDPEMIESLHFTKQLGLEIKTILEAGDVDELGRLMHEHWLRKRSRAEGMSSQQIDQAYEHGRSCGGATGGKLVGAGGGGFLLFYTKDRGRLRQAMADIGMAEMEFRFDFEGSVVQLGA
jgi:D-glycero-alpha-D-manno-heptose-7-phosphate kinase